MDELERYMQVIKLVNLLKQNWVFSPIYMSVGKERRRDRDATPFCHALGLYTLGSTIQFNPVGMCSLSALKKAWIFW